MPAFHAGLKGCMDGQVTQSDLLGAGAAEAGHASEGALLGLDRSIGKANRWGRFQLLPSASI
jgi:hypothetical protein